MIIKETDDVPSERIDLLSYLSNGFFEEATFDRFDSDIWQY